MVEWLDQVLREAGALGLLALLASSALEYLFPPFPGDTISVFGGIYAVRRIQPPALVFLALMAGSLLGAAADYLVGRWLGARLAREPADTRHLRFVTHAQILEWEERFRRRGTLWLVLNRFLPGVRGPIFLAAGISGIAPLRVLTLGGLSALAWNGLLFAGGWAVGGNAERLESLVRTYSRAATAVLLALAFAAGLRALWRWRRKRGVGNPEK